MEDTTDHPHPDDTDAAVEKDDESLPSPDVELCK